MRGGWNAVIFRSEAYAATLPPEGVSGAVFEKAALSDVDPRDCDEVLRLLHRRRVVWVSRQRGMVRVYGRRPDVPPPVRKPSHETVFAQAVAGGMLELVDAAADLDRAKRDKVDLPSASARAHTMASRVAGAAAIQIGKGSVSLPEARAVMWRLFPVSAMKLVAFHAPRLDFDSPHERLPDAPPPKPKRIASGLSLDERVFRLIEKAGAKGVSRTDLVKAIPKVRHQDVEDVTAQLASADMIVSGRMRFGRTGRHGTRYFTAEIGLPRLTSRGEVIVEY